MPGMSGFELIDRMRTDPATKDIPVLVLTGKDLTAEDSASLRRATRAVFLKGKDWRTELIATLNRVRNANDKAVHEENTRR
jgi:CheY-like chemotaxis protein